ncbi:DUF885 domain-containing protein [candidate division KSB1 bacterium]|nr:DUF885 domain-containing protein [candidate division KSB1 bacterium]NIR69078.1 DUF885 domain-containing protein [candidate division KSB1 bacterium]NIS25640.1 DUF885 domain-containing protein [candidate division KSB1 bacterium]NIT72504.1 DUF885 domain-containing protein [candidate division KSB1 bacterium]NIU26317.1 DUF885 domain-containing protein [candidate division KSB1 bacterium]
MSFLYELHGKKEQTSCGRFTRIQPDSPWSIFRKVVILVIILISTAAWAQTTTQENNKEGNSYEDLVEIFKDWREFQKPTLVDGIPDYTADAMAKQHRELTEYRQRLAAVDTSGWSVSQRVDYLLIWAEMNGLDFDHRVHRPWARNPAFYTMIWPSQSDVPRREGPVLHGTIELWQYEFPLTPERAADLTEQLRTVPKIFEQAKGNLVENARDLWLGGVRRMKRQNQDLDALARRVAGTNGELDSAIQQAREATDEFVAWLEAEAPSKTGPSGVGKENYNWYLKNVYLLPYTWEEEVTIMRRELARAHASLRLEEHHNRELPPLTPIASAEEYDNRLNAAVTEFMQFLKEEEIVTVKDYMDPALRAKIGSFTPPDEYRHFFAKINLRDPVVMRTHFYHWIELARMKHEPHPSPIRRVPLLYNIFAFRAEGLATAMEEMMMHAGLFDDRPRARELIWILVAQRAARALGGLYMHSNDWTMQQAVDFACEWTPRGWLEKDGALVWFEQDLYLKQPGYGTSYITGKVEIENLMSERARQLGDDFTLKRFMDEVNSAGVIPLSLVRWQLTGKDDEITHLLQSR